MGDFNKLGVEDLVRIYGLSEKSAQQIVERRTQTDRLVKEKVERIKALKKGEVFVLCIWHEQHGTHPIGISSNIEALEQRSNVFDTKSEWTSFNPSPLYNVVQSRRLNEHEHLIIRRIPEF